MAAQERMAEDAKEIREKISLAGAIVPTEQYSKGNCPHADWYNIGPWRVRCKVCGAVGQWGRSPDDPGRHGISW